MSCWCLSCCCRRTTSFTTDPDDDDFVWVTCECEWNEAVDDDADNTDGDIDDDDGCPGRAEREER